MNLAQWIVPLSLLGLFADARADEEKIKVEDLPKAVARAVKKAFPEARIVGASKEKNDEGETVYEVETKLDGRSIDLILDPEGEIEVVEKEIETEDLPRAVLKAAKTKFPKARITKVEELTGEDNKVVYELAFAIEGKETTQVVFAANGKVVEEENDEKGEAKKKEKDDNDKGKKNDKDDDDDKKGKKNDKDDDDDDKGKKKDKDDDEKGEKKEKPRG